MKFKKLLGGGLLATVLALGVGAGLAVHSESKEANAATSETTFYVDVRNSIWGSSNIGNVKMYFSKTDSSNFWLTQESGGGLAQITIDDVTYVTFTISDTSEIELGVVVCWGWGSLGNQTDDFYFTSASTTDNLLTVTSGGNWETKNSVAWSHIDVSDTVDVIEHGVCDDDVAHSWVIDTVPAEKGKTFAVPSPARLDGYHFGGWFTDPDCLESHRYTAQVLNDDLDLYAKFTTLSKNSYIYYLQDEATNNYVYTWGGENEFGPAGSQGSAITSVSTEVHGVLNFEGRTQYIYKIEFSSEAADTKLKFQYNNWEKETHEMQLVAGAAYWWSETIDAHNTDAGAAIDLLLKIEAARNNSAQYKGLDFSVCGIDKDTAGDLIDEYDNTLTDEGREFVDGTYTKTYDPSKSASESPSEVQVKYSLIIAKLREIADGTEPNLNTRSISLFGDIDNSTPIMLVVIISVVSLTAVGGYIFLKRRKEN